MKVYESFYKNGFELLQFDSFGLGDILKDILEARLKEGFSLQKKYANTTDLRPNVVDYSSTFLDVLKANNIKSFIKSRTFKDPTLYHIQARVVNSTISYMDWHRDTYYDSDKSIGMTPPVYKLIYYPNFEEDITPRLNVAVGSHRIMLNERIDDLKLVSILPKATIYASNNQALFFDTSLLHAVIPEEPNSKSIRLIYSFIAKEQLNDINDAELHHRTSKMYEDTI